MTPARFLLFITSCLLVVAIGSAYASEDPSSTLTPHIDDLPTGILYDRVLPLSGIERYDGTDESATGSLGSWLQIYHEMRRASLVEPDWPSIQALRSAHVVEAGVETVPIAVIDLRYNRIDPEGVWESTWGQELLTRQVFAVSPLKESTYRGQRCVFRFDREHYISNRGSDIRVIEVDLDDGHGYRTASFGQDLCVSYQSEGRKSISIRFTLEDGARLQASSYFNVLRLQTPAPDDTLAVTATIPYLGQFGTGEAYLYLADTHSALTNPVILVEGFDLDNSMNWDELYALLNREALLENLRSQGFDAVVLNFTDAIDYLQRNSFVLVELIAQVNALIPGENDIAVVGASMGGLVSRYALAYMEENALSHNARLFLSFDSPQRGANIPLGIQYWLAFFADESAEAAELLAALNSPAARQLLAYHYTDPPEATGTADPLRDEMIADFAAIGDYPAGLRKVAVANGSAAQVDQGFAAGQQIIEWEYNSILVDVIGNVWAVPDASSGLIFHGKIDPILFPPDEMQVVVSGTRPFDNAPGGWRASMAEMAEVEAPYGDIIALHANHCFIPTVSALAVETEDFFYDIAGDAELLDHTPFDAVYFPLVNEEHVLITPENAEWVMSEILGDTDSVEHLASSGVMPILRSTAPNPFGGTTTIEWWLPKVGRVGLAAYDVGGRRVAVIVDRHSVAGGSKTTWDGSAHDGTRLRPGVYFLRLTDGTFTVSKKVLLE